MSRPGYRTSWKVPKIGALRVPARAPQPLGDPTCHLGPRAEAQLGQDVLEMALNRSFRQEQALGDAATRHAGGNEPGDLQLPLAQAAGAAGFLAGRLARQREELRQRYRPSRLPRLVGDPLRQSGASLV